MEIEKSFLQMESESQDMYSVRDQLIQSLKTSKGYRDSFVEEKVRSGISSQVRTIREKLGGMNQTEFARMLGTTQSWVARLENPDEALPTLSTLLEVAHGLDVDLVVRFAPFSESVDWMSGRPHLISGLSQEALAVKSFAEEEHSGFLDLMHLSVASLRQAETNIVDADILKSGNANRLLQRRSEESEMKYANKKSLAEITEATTITEKLRRPHLRLVPRSARINPVYFRDENNMTITSLSNVESA